MREIKFRAWDKKKSQMEYQDDMRFLVLQGKETPVGYNDVILMQYTNLKDKNDRECYEKDRIQNRLTEHNGIVEWDDGSACFAVKDENGQWVASLGAFNFDGFEITGNVYESN